MQKEPEVSNRRAQLFDFLGWHKSYLKFRAFIDCTGHHATHSIRHGQLAAPAPTSNACFSKQDSALFLCDSCLDFWRECQQNRDLTTWDIAVYLRLQGGFHH